MKEVALLSRKGAGGGGDSDACRYWAFLSYSHKDSADADWLHGALERYRVPAALVGEAGPAGPIPASFSPIFRDRHELAASGDLGHTIRQALGTSRCLIVLCSPDAAQSRWTNEEVLAFRKMRPGAPVLAAIVAGEPFASDIPGREAEECFPPALRHAVDRRGRPTARRSEPIAADLRASGDGRRLGLLKLVAGMLGVGLDDLVQREQQRRNRRLTYIAAASLAGMTLTSGLAVFAFDSRDAARDQRREAEGLVGFMLGDLRSKLEPIGRLDALDAVGARALDYFERQDKSELSDAALAQRSRALTMMGEIANARGDLDGALRRYGEAMSGTGEMLRRAPDDPQRLFDHAQNMFWIGSIALQRGQLDKAEAAFREYKNLAYRMIAIDPAGPKWRMETQYADANLGIVLYRQRRWAEASAQFRQALATIERQAAAEPGNAAYQRSVSESLAWLADSYRSEGRLDEAIAQRERQVALLDGLNDRGRSDVQFRQRLIPAHQALGRLLAAKGDVALATGHLRAAVAEAESLIPMEPDNARWLDFAAGARFALAEARLAAGDRDEAAAQTRAGCDLVDRLVALDSSVAGWRGLRPTCLTLRARLALAAGALAEALPLASQALAAARSQDSGNPVDDRYSIASALRLIGDIRRRSGDAQAARQAWRDGLAALPRGVNERPSELNERLQLLSRLGRAAEAAPLRRRLETIGYHPIG